MPLLTEAQLKSMYSVQNAILNEQEKTEFLDACQKIKDETGYFLTRRDSSVSALRIYLMAEKGFSLDQVVDLEKLPKEQILQHMKDFTNFLGDPALSKEEKIARIGKMHGKAFKKIVDENIPDPGELNSLEDFAKIQKKMFVMGTLYIDSTQDVESFAGSQTKYPELKALYYKSGGGQNGIEKDLNYWTLFSKNFYDTYKKIFEEGSIPESSKAAIFDFSKDFFKKYGGKKMTSIPLKDSMIYGGIVARAIEKGVMYNSPEQVQEVKKYLRGEVATYPGKNEIKAAIDAGKREDFLSINTYANDADILSNSAMEHLIGNALSDEQLKQKDLTRLPASIKKQLIKAYDETFGRFYTGDTMFNIIDNGMDQYDLIKTSAGNSIRQIAGNTYDKYQGVEKEDAMKLEVMRALAVEKKGLKYQYVNTKADGSLELSEERTVKKVPDEFIIHINKDFSQADVMQYLRLTR